MRDTITPAHRLLPERSERRYFALVLALVMVALSGVSYLAISASIRQARDPLLERIEAGERQTVAAMQREAANTLLEITADLQTFRSVFERVEGSAQVRWRLNRFLLDFMGSHRGYDQLRYIGADGVEQIRVDNEASGPELAASERLQDKSATRYFELARDLGPGEVMITPLDVNRDNGEIEFPLNPVIRILGKVAFADGDAPGLLVFNYRVALLLENMRQIGATAVGRPQIVSGRGVEALERLAIGTPDALVDINAVPSFAERYPVAWAALQRDVTQRIDDGAGGIMVASRFQPSSLAIPDTVGSALDFTLPMQGVPDREGYWYIVSHIDAEALDDLVRLGLRLSRTTLALFAVILVGLGWFLSLRLSSYRSDAARMRELATTDALTGLLNRGEFERRLAALIAHARRHHRATGLIYVDLDGFKPVNDRLGHAAGDQLLRHVAETLTDATRESDLVARVGGDEFAVALNDVRGRSDTEAVTKKLYELLGHPVVVAGGTWNAGASVGGATYPDDAGSLEALFEHADAAMYRVKAERREDNRADTAWAI